MNSLAVYSILRLFNEYHPFDLLIYHNEEWNKEEIELEWYLRPDFIVSVSIDEKGIHYAYLLEECRGHGFISLNSPLTEDLIQAIKKVLEKSNEGQSISHCTEGTSNKKEITTS